MNKIIIAIMLISVGLLTAFSAVAKTPQQNGDFEEICEDSIGQKFNTMGNNKILQKSPKVGSTCLPNDSYCEDRSCGGREKVCNCIGTPPVCTWSDWNGCGQHIACEKGGGSGGYC